MTDRYYLSYKNRYRVMEKSDYACWYCGVQLFRGNEHRMSSTKPDGTIDHFLPLAMGGKSNNENLVPSCRSCNSSKGKSSIGEYRDRMKKKNGDGFLFYFEKKGLSA
jgi:5-methylcytosine-specific restriction endonuclease McrA